MEAEKSDYSDGLDDLIKDFVGSEWYRLLNEQNRWEQFKSETTSKEEWQTEFLDADANNAQHGFINAILAENVCDIDEEPDHIKDILIKTCLLRDLGEAEFGDINYDVKTKVQKLKELVRLSEILRSESFSSLSEEDATKILSIRMSMPGYTELSHEAEVFQHIQRLGWLRTAIIATESAKNLQEDMYGKSDENPSQFYRLHWLAHSVFGNHLVPVIEAASTRESALVFLSENQEFIEYSFRSLLKEDVQETLENYYDKTEIAGVDSAKQDRKLITAMQRWREFQATVLDPEFALDPERQIADLDHLRSLVGMLRRQNRTIALTSGSFDALHPNHMRYLRAAKQNADVLIVGLDSDEKVKQRKGEDRPYWSQDERQEGLLHLRWTDYAIIKELSWKSQAVIRTVKPDILILSEDTHYKDLPDALKDLEEICGKIVILPRMGKRTTSTTIRQMLLAGEFKEEIKKREEENT